jgi:hypothetical protein
MTLQGHLEPRDSDDKATRPVSCMGNSAKSNALSAMFVLQDSGNYAPSSPARQPFQELVTRDLSS